MSTALKFWLVFLLSFLASAVLLGLERAVGLGWDFHPDSVTYATTSETVYESIVENWFGLFNNGYYVVAYFLGESIAAITLMNMLVFALTNGFIYKLIREKSNYPVTEALMLLLLLNPYRVHLSTTLLKETLIIFLLILIVSSTNSARVLPIVGMFILRIASPLYLTVLMSKRLLFYGFLAVCLITVFYWDAALGRIIEFNVQEMRLRDFDTIPTFQDYGLWGAFLRGIVWSLLAVSGLFALVSPAPAYVPLAVGSIMTLIFLKKATGSFKIPLQLLVVTFLFGVMVTGFTAYIRYIYPVLIAWPLIALMKND
jgi:hypothetical protein